jgi:hypothetical protein
MESVCRVFPSENWAARKSIGPRASHQLVAGVVGMVNGEAPLI